MRLSSRAGAETPILMSTGRDLLEQIRWFNRLRAAATIGMLLLIVSADLAGILPEPGPLYAMEAVAVVVALLCAAWARRPVLRAEATLRRHVELQIAVDLAVLTGMLHFSGGVTNPLVLAYLFHVLIAAFLQSMRAAVGVAAVSMALILGLAWSEFSGWIPYHPLAIDLFDLRRMQVGDLAVWVASLALLLASSLFLVSFIAARLSRREGELVSLSRQLARSERLASVGTLAAGVSHEINNPLGVIRHKAKILRYRIGDGDSAEELLDEVDTIDKHSQRIVSITEGLLAFAREVPFELKPVAVNELIREAASLVRLPYRNAEIDLQLHPATEDPQVAGSGNHLLQVLVNVLLNARDASPQAGRVDMSVECDVAEVVLRVADRGEGIEAATLDKIFDPFFTTKATGRGTGLGLALSHGIVERHGGRIEVESEVGRGSTFHIVLPRSSASARW